MTNNSGKFRFKVSHSDIDNDIYRTDATGPAIPEAVTEPETAPDTSAVASEIPAVPACSDTGEEGALHKVRRYLGELWWLWCVAAAIFIINRKG